MTTDTRKTPGARARLHAIAAAAVLGATALLGVTPRAIPACSQ